MSVQMSEETASFYIIVWDAPFVDIPLAKRAVSFPVNVASPNNSWYKSLLLSSPCLPEMEPIKQRNRTTMLHIC